MNNLKQNFSYSFIYQFLIIVLPLATTPYISRVLGPEGIGVFSYTSSIASFFMIFAMLGVKNYGNRTIAKNRDVKETLSRNFWNIYILQLVTSLLIISLYLLYILIFVEEFFWIATIQSLLLISAAMDITWFFFGLEKFKITIVRNIIIRVLSVLLIFVFVNDKSDLWIYTLIMAGGTFLTQLSLWPLLKKDVYFIMPTINVMKDHFKSNLILFIPVLAISIYKIMDKIMLGNMADISQVGFYENTEKIINIPMGVIIAVGSVMLPRMSNMAAKGEIKKSKSYIETSMFFIIIISSGMTFGIAGVAEVFAPIFFGEEFSETGILIILISPIILFISWANVIRTQYLIPNNRDKTYISSVVIGAFVNFTINIALIPKYGALGAVIGTVAAELSVALIQTLMIKRELEVTKYFKRGIPFLIYGLLMFICIKSVELLTLNNYYILIIQLISGALIYLTLVAVHLKITNNYFFSKYLSTKK